jgi:hypothetical protein
LRRQESRMSFERRFQSIRRRSTRRPAVPQIPSCLIDGAPERMDRSTIFLPNDRSSVRSCTN